MNKSSITIRDGVGYINYEPVTTDVDYTDRGGFNTRRMRIDCGNGYKLSVVFGSCTYSSNHDHGLGDCGEWREEVETAEIGLLGPRGLDQEMFSDEWGDGVKGNCDAEEITHWLLRIRELPGVDREAV